MTDKKNAVPEGLMAMSDTPLTPLPEAGGSVSGKIWHEHTGGDWLVTARGEDLEQAILNLKKGIKYALENGFVLTDPRRAVAPQPVTAPAPSEEVVPSPAAAGSTVPGPSLTPSPPPAAGGVSTFACVYMEVRPEANGRTRLNLYGNDKKTPRNDYPTLSLTRSTLDVLHLLQSVGPWHPEHLMEAKNYDVAFQVDWKPGRATGKSDKDGNPTYYKDVTAFRN